MEVVGVSHNNTNIHPHCPLAESSIENYGMYRPLPQHHRMAFLVGVGSCGYKLGNLAQVYHN